MAKGNFEDQDIRTGKAPKHQAAAIKAAKKAANDISNAEIKQKWENKESDKIKKEIDSWNPEKDKVSKLSNLLRKLEKAAGVGTEVWTPNDPRWIYHLDSLPVAKDYQEFIDEIRNKNMYNWVWTIDYQGNALVGDEVNEIDNVNTLDGYYPEKHGFSFEEVEEIETQVGAKLLEDEPYDEMRGKIYQFDDDSEWLIFKNSDVAERKAVKYVKEMLEDEPGSFDQDWLQNYISMTDDDRCMIADTDANAYAEDQLSDDDAMKEAGFDEKFDELQEEVEDLESEIENLEEEKANLELEKENEEVEEIEDENKINKLSNEINDLESEISNKMNEIYMKGKEQEALPDEAKEKVQSDKYDEIYHKLEDPVQYFVEDQASYDIEELMKASFITINVDNAAQDAIDEDGIGHFLSTYDGEEVTLDNGMIMYRIN